MKNNQQNQKRNLARLEKQLIKKFETKSKVMALKRDVKVVLVGDMCATDNETVYLPAVDLSDPDSLVLLEGAADHEIGHIKHTPMSSTKAAYEISPLVKWLYNAVEDVRMERAVIAEYKGARRTLSGLVDQAIKREWFKATQPDSSVKELFTSYVLYCVRYRYMNQTQLKDIYLTVVNHVTDALGHSLLKKIDDVFPKITYKDSMLKYGNDKPDLRFSLEIKDVTEFFANSGFTIFAKSIENGSVVRAIPGPHCGSRSVADRMNSWAQGEGAPGMGYIIFSDETGKGPIANALGIDKALKMKALFNLEDGDALFFSCANNNYK